MTYPGQMWCKSCRKYVRNLAHWSGKRSPHRAMMQRARKRHGKKARRSKGDKWVQKGGKGGTYRLKSGGKTITITIR